MFTDKDILQLNLLGITKEKLFRQVNDLNQGYPYLKIFRAAAVGEGILMLNDSKRQDFIKKWHEYINSEYGKRILKFVPASGAASRMFKCLYEFKNSDSLFPNSDDLKYFFSKLNDFAFFDELNHKCIEAKGSDVSVLLSKNQYKDIIEILLDSSYMSYGTLPKALLKFHKYPGFVRNPIEEHLVEGALYTKNSNGIVNIHFTVSPEHIDLLTNYIDIIKSKYETLFGVVYNVDFSLQKKSTNTIALNADGTIARNEDGTILLRPGGHGALIENLNSLDFDIVFIKNIDNVVPDKIKAVTVEYKEVLAGILVTYQQKLFEYIKILNEGNGSISELILSEMFDFAENVLSVKNKHADLLTKNEQINYLLSIFNRPIRVCGMVKNEGEPGGGPYLVYNADGSISPQILESSQINKLDDFAVKCMHDSQFFNPVDIVCGIKDYKGEKFNLLDFVDYNTGFISEKSKDGVMLKVLELPGLWNGAMSNWNTIFVEVPALTFNPVKTVNDLLREEH